MNDRQYGELIIRMDVKLKDIHRWCYGNGVTGAAERLTVLEQDVAHINRARHWPNYVSALCCIAAVIMSIHYGNIQIEQTREMIAAELQSND